MLVVFSHRSAGALVAFVELHRRGRAARLVESHSGIIA